MKDLIDRQAAIDAVLDRMDVEKHGRDAKPEEIQWTLEKLPSAQPEQRWMPVKTRPMTEDERKYYEEIYAWKLDDDDAVMFDCKMPEDGQEVWVCSKHRIIWIDTCIVEDGIGLEGNGDWSDIVAWMPFNKPEPYKEGEDE